MLVDKQKNCTIWEFSLILHRSITFWGYPDCGWGNILFDDDNEYILDIREASVCTGFYLHTFFVIMLASDCLAQLELVWESTW